MGLADHNDRQGRAAPFQLSGQRQLAGVGAVDLEHHTAGHHHRRNLKKGLGRRELVHLVACPLKHKRQLSS